MNIVWRKAAQADLDGIFDYLVDANPQAALRLYAAIRSRVERLADHPAFGRAGRVPDTGVLVEQEGRVLLVRRRNEPGRGRWCLPCGFEDADESPEQAARREAREEAGLELVLDEVLGIYHYTDDPRGAGILVVFRAHCDG